MEPTGPKGRPTMSTGGSEGSAPLTAKTPQVALIVETSNAYARGLLRGVWEYITSHPGWSVYLGEHSRLEADPAWLDGWRGQGVLARIENKQIADQVRSLGLPAVDLSAARLIPEIPGVETDDAEIARLAVEHFYVRGLRNFAYCGDPRFRWSVKRWASFSDHVRELGTEAHEYRMKPSGTLADDRASLVEWLVQLPKPVGVMACYDIAGQELLEACRLAKLDVPDSVAVLGVDNDEFICNLTSPPLSSVQPDSIRTGYLAATLLGKMMAGEAVQPELHLIQPLRVVTRQSSDILSVSDPIVANALKLIRERVDLDTPVSLIERHVGLSRRALDYKFVQTIGRTVHEEITRVRMERLADLLLLTNWPLPEIANRMNFRHAEYMGVAFKRFTGKSPGQFRRVNRPEFPA